jgi:hypothetical protein
VGWSNDVRNQTQAALTPLLAQQNQMQAQLGSQVAASIQAQALSGDMNALQAASDDQYAAIQGEIGKQEGFIDSATAELKAMGEDQAAAIGAEADELKGVADAAYGDVKGQVGKADELAAQATEEFRKVKSEYKDLAAQNASTAAFSIGRSAQQQRMQIQQRRAEPDAGCVDAAVGTAESDAGTAW